MGFERPKKEAGYFRKGFVVRERGKRNLREALKPGKIEFGEAEFGNPMKKGIIKRDFQKSLELKKAVAKKTYF